MPSVVYTYLSTTLSSSVRDATVRIAETDSEAIAALAAKRSPIEASRRDSIAKRSHAEMMIGRRAPNITTRASFQPTTKDVIQVESRLTSVMEMMAILMPSSSCSCVGAVDSLEAIAPVVFSCLSKKLMS